MGPSITRRRALQTGVVSLGASLAGCAGRVLGDASDRVARNSTFEETWFDGADLVVRLRENTDVSTVNLVGPDGQLFTSANVATGVTTVRLSLFDMLSGRHYSPGKHTLVGVRDDEEVASATLDLRPELEIVGVEPYTGGRDVPLNRGNLVVTVKNVGTGPTWIYYIGYEGAPYELANEIPPFEETKYQPEVYLPYPETAEGRILSPNESADFRGRFPPLVLSRDAPCDGQTADLTVIASSGIGNTGKDNIRASLLGGPLQNRHRTTCQRIIAEVLGEE